MDIEAVKDEVEKSYGFNIKSIDKIKNVYKIKNENDKFVNPSFDAGILVGDRIISVAGEEIHYQQEISSLDYAATTTEYPSAL